MSDTNVKNESASTLEISDVLCHICFGILIYPVTMPCQHRMCMECFDRNIEINTLSCPMCKMRIGIWCRRMKAKAKKKTNFKGLSSSSSALIDQALWDNIQKSFPQRVELRMLGNEESLDDLDELFPCVATHNHVEKQGQIREEFNREKALWNEKRMKEQEEEEEASMKLIAQIKKEDAKKKKQTIPSQKALSPSLQKIMTRKKRLENAKQSKLHNFLSNAPPQKKVEEKIPANSGPSRAEMNSSLEFVDCQKEIDLVSFLPNCENVDFQKQKEALEAIERSKKDEEIARELQKKENSSKNLNDIDTPKLTKSSSAFRFERKSDGKILRQLSLEQSFIR